jgi:hypothetical protein
VPRTIASKQPGARSAGASKRFPLNMRTTAELRERLERSAILYGRSLAQEVEVRLEHSLNREEHLIEWWGPDFFAIAESMARSLWWIESFTGKRWVEDDRTFNLFTRTVAEIISAYRDRVLVQRRDTPGGGLEGKSDQELARMFSAMGGMTPPRPNVRRDPERDTAERAANLKVWEKTLEEFNARPLSARPVREKRK